MENLVGVKTKTEERKVQGLYARTNNKFLLRVIHWLTYLCYIFIFAFLYIYLKKLYYYLIHPLSYLSYLSIHNSYHRYRKSTFISIYLYISLYL